MVWNTITFTKSIFSVTGKDMTVFVDQWVRMGGHAKFVLKFVFNRKRNTVELEINQDAANNMEQGVRKYVGPVKIALQELDGQFPHTFQVLVKVIFLFILETSTRVPVSKSIERFPVITRFLDRCRQNKIARLYLFFKYSVDE